MMNSRIQAIVDRAETKMLYADLENRELDIQKEKVQQECQMYHQLVFEFNNKEFEKDLELAFDKAILLSKRYKLLKIKIQFAKSLMNVVKRLLEM